MIKLENISIRFGRKVILKDITVNFEPGKAWVIAGINGSGKSILGKVLAKLIKPEKGNIYVDVKTAYSSFELQDKIIESEKKKDSSRLMHGAVDSGTSVEQFLELKAFEDQIYADKLIKMFSISGILDRGLRFLSTGEFRKTILLSALLKNPDLLIIDDPFDGLDSLSRKNLKQIINELAENNQKIIIITNKIEDIFSQCTHMLLLSEGVVKYSGKLSKGIDIFKSEQFKEKKSGIITNIPDEINLNNIETDISNEILIEMKDVSVSYDEVLVLDNINWKVKKGDKWKITGVNGAGKSTLLNLVNGDNQKAYGNNISLFGRKKGSGESVWDIKKKIGYVSGDFQLKYRVRSTVLDVVISGLYDSIGLYSEITTYDLEKGRKWLEFTGLSKKANNYFRELSYGEMRMALIARAMIKFPELLILDEPCQGLDSFHKTKVLDLCEKIGTRESSTILFVTHDSTVNLECFNHYLVLEKIVH